MNKLTKGILTCWVAAAVGAAAQFQGQDHIEPVPEAEIIGVERSGDGVDLFFHTQPGGVYFSNPTYGDLTPYDQDERSYQLWSIATKTTMNLYSFISASQSGLDSTLPRDERRFMMVFPEALSTPEHEWIQTRITRVHIKDLTTGTDETINKYSVKPYLDWANIVYWIGTKDYSFNTSRTYHIRVDVD